MTKFKPGDKVIMKEEVTKQDILEMAISPVVHQEIKGKEVTVYEFSENGNKYNTLLLEESPYIWDAKWFRHLILVPNELFEI